MGHTLKNGVLLFLEVLRIWGYCHSGPDFVGLSLGVLQVRRRCENRLLVGFGNGERVLHQLIMVSQLVQGPKVLIIGEHIKISNPVVPLVSHVHFDDLLREADVGSAVDKRVD